MRAAGGGELRLGKRVDTFTATEVGDDDKVPLLRAYLKRWKAEVGVFFGGVGPDSSPRSCGASPPTTRSSGSRSRADRPGADGHSVVGVLSATVVAATAERRSSADRARPAIGWERTNSPSVVEPRVIPANALQAGRKLVIAAWSMPGRRSKAASMLLPTAISTPSPALIAKA